MTPTRKKADMNSIFVSSKALAVKVAREQASKFFPAYVLATDRQATFAVTVHESECRRLGAFGYVVVAMIAKVQS